MVKRICFVLLISVSCSFALKAQMFEFSLRDATKLTNRKLIVVLQAEDPVILNRLKRDTVKTNRYKALIAYTNHLLKRTATNFWKAGQAIEFRTFEECKTLNDTSHSYFTLEFASLRANDNSVLYLLKPDTSDLYIARNELIQRREYGYFELKLMEKFRSPAFYTFNTPSSIPNEYDFATAFQFLSALVKEKINNPKSIARDYELKIQHNNSTLKRRTLMVDSNVVNKQSRSYAYIAKEYDSLCLYKLSDPKGMAEMIYSKDTTFAYLAIVPYIDPIGRGQSYIGPTGGTINDYERKVYFTQLIFDIGTGELLYYDKTEENVILVRDWKRFLRYSKESTIPFPKIQKSISPYQQQNPQNQY